jgi:acrylyl-CoA reductase (NADPH)
MMYGGCIANSGLTGGVELKSTVLPFILRGVKLLGIDSVMCPVAMRTEVWRRIAGDLKPSHLAAATRTLSLSELPEAFATLLGGQARGRFVVDLSST